MVHSSFGIPDGDLETAICLLYDEVASARSTNKKMPNKIILIKMTRKNYDIGLLEAMNLVEEMEKRYENNLKEMGYF